MAGRPSKYSEELAEDICARLAGGESLRSICRDDAMPNKATVLRWVVKPDHPFCDQYMIAREAAGYSHADNVSDLSDELRTHEDADPQKARVAMMGYQWAAERMAPKKHSPKQLMEHTGKDGGPIETNATIDPSKLSSAALRELVNARTEADE